MKLNKRAGTLGLALLIGISTPITTLGQIAVQGHTVLVEYINHKGNHIRPPENITLLEGNLKEIEAPRIQGYTKPEGKAGKQIVYFQGDGEESVVTFRYKEYIPPKIEVLRNMFKDVRGDEWYAKDLLKVTHIGIINGMVDKKGQLVFQANDSLSHAHWYTMTARLFGATGEGEERYFTDLKPLQERKEGEQWYTPYVKALEEGGAIEKGIDDKTLNSGITRLEAIKVLTKLAEKHGVPTQEIKKSFTDTKGIEGNFVAIVEGFPDGSYGVNDILTRAQAASLISRLLDSVNTN